MKTLITVISLLMWAYPAFAFASSSWVRYTNLVLVIEENADYQMIFPNGCSSTSCDSPTMPNLARLINSPPLGNGTGVANEYYSSGHPSLGNYLTIWSGDAHGVLGKDCAVDAHCSALSNACWNMIPGGTWNRNTQGGALKVSDLSLALDTLGKTWVSYAEDLPTSSSDICRSGLYVVQHNPALYFDDVRGHQLQMQNIVPFSQFAPDLQTRSLRTVSIIIPNTCDNSHDSGDFVRDMPNGHFDASCDQHHADDWLQKNVIAPLFGPGGPTAFKPGGGGLLVIAWDEALHGCEPHALPCPQMPVWGSGGHIPFIITGSRIKPGYRSNTKFQHPALTRLILEGSGGVSFPADASWAPSMSEFFGEPN